VQRQNPWANSDTDTESLAETETELRSTGTGDLGAEVAPLVFAH